MDAVEARAQVTKILRAFRAMESLEDVLEVAAKVDSERTNVQRALAQAKQGVEDAKLAKTLLDKEYATKQADGNAALAKLKQLYAEYEAAQRSQKNALDAQTDAAQKALNELRVEYQRVSSDNAKQAQAAKDAVQRQFDTLKADLVAEEVALRQKLEATRSELTALVRSVRL